MFIQPKPRPIRDPEVPAGRDVLAATRDFRSPNMLSCHRWRRACCRSGRDRGFLCSDFVSVSKDDDRVEPPEAGDSRVIMEHFLSVKPTIDRGNVPRQSSSSTIRNRDGEVIKG